MDHLEFIILDCLTALLILTAALFLPRSFLPSAGQAMAPPRPHWLFRRPYRPILVVFAASFALNLLFACLYQMPIPWVHDEFAYLLTSDTFASGRLTNETHSMWKHLESFHVFHTPSYQAKYPPGQGLFLALGQLLTGEPAVGVWLSLALACAAVSWMLMAVFPASWAMVGGLLAAVCRFMVVKWGQSYWGGAVAMLGGALMFGALFRFRNRIKARDAVLLALGLVILANTRPYEGFIVSIPSAVYALWLTLSWVRKNGWRQVTVRFLIPVSALLMIAGAGMLFYNYRLVGDPWKLPYIHHQSLVSEHEIIRDFTGSPPLSLPVKLLRLWLFYVGPLLSVALISLKSIVLKWESCFALALTVLLFCVSALSSRAWPHYTAPVACLVYLVMVQGLIGLREVQWRGRPVGALLARAIPMACVASSLIMLGALLYQGPVTLWAHQRQSVLDDLVPGEERHLIVVRYAENHYLHKEWVYNRADIDAADVVWAREMSPAENRQLFEYFRDRKKWLLLADEDPAQLFPLVRVVPESSSRKTELNHE